MATRAIRCCLRADFRGGSPSANSPIMLCVFACTMAAQALLIVKMRISHQGRMRVMALRAGEARILGALPTTALLQTIGLKANCEGTGLGLIHDHIHRCSMTCSAKIDRACRSQRGRIEDGLASFRNLAGHDRFHMILSGAVASLAMHSRDSLCSIQL